MEMSNIGSHHQLSQWQTYPWSLDAFNFCKTHRSKIWTTCAAVFHYDWDLKVTKEKEFVETVVQIVEDLVERIAIDGVSYGLDRAWLEFKDWINEIKETSKDFK